MISKRFRTDYEGEFVVTRTTFSNGKKLQDREWVPNPIKNEHISGRATVIGTGDSTSVFDYSRLARHRGGLLGKKKLQTYGTGTSFQKLRCDFYITNHRDLIQAVLASGYQQDSVVYTGAINCIKYAGEFYLVPFSPRLVDAATACYLAAFDGHQEVFLLGIDQDANQPTTVESSQILDVVKVYDNVTWYVVSDHKTVPKNLLDHPRVRLMNYREYISYCDI